MTSNDKSAYAPIPSLKNKYEINRAGTVRNAQTKRPLHAYIVCDTPYVAVRFNGANSKRSINRLLKEVFGAGDPSCNPRAVPCTIDNGDEQHSFGNLYACAEFIASRGHFCISTVRARLTSRPPDFDGWKINYADAGEPALKKFLLDCWYCGKEFEASSGAAKYCSDKCRDAAAAQKAARIARIKKRNKPRKPLDEWIKEAAACGMNYGAYRAAIEQLDQTFEELKAWNDVRKGGSFDENS